MHRVIGCFAFLFLFLGVTLWAKSEQNYGEKVIVIKVGEDSLTHTQGFQFMKRVLEKAEEEKARAIVFDLNTPGGLAWETSDMMMKTMQERKLPMYAFVNPRAMSAGALLASACDKIYMAPVSAIGAAGLVDGSGKEIEPMMRRKAESAFDAFTRSVVVKKGHNPALIRAMMIPSQEEQKFGSVVVKADALLTLTGEEAVALDESGKPLLAVGIANDINDLLIKENIEAPVMIAEPTGFERIAQWLAWISPLLILIGMAGIYFEMKTPGFGIGGIVAIVAFALFFLGNNVVGNLAGYEMVALFVLGVVLLGTEIALGGSTIVLGIIGVGCMLVALFCGMLDGLSVERLLDTDSPAWGDYFDVAVMPAVKLAIGCVGGTIAILLMMRYLPDTSIFHRLSNKTASAIDEDSVPEKVSFSHLEEGETLTELNPGGKARIGEKVVDVSSVGGVIPAHSRIRVVGKNAFETLVEKIN